MNHALVRHVAMKVRTWAEAEGQKQGFASDLECFCAIGAAKLFLELHAHGVHNAVIAANDSHCFVQIQDWIVDVTASQFGRENVFIQKRSELKNVSYNTEWWNRGHQFTDVQEFRSWQANWPPGQIVPKELLP